MAFRKITQFETQSTVGSDKAPGETLVLVPKKKKITMSTKSSKDKLKTRLSFIDAEMQNAIDMRNQLKIRETIDGQLLDVTPKPINVVFENEASRRLTRKAREIRKTHGSTQPTWSATGSVVRSKSSRGMGLRVSMEDILVGVGSERMLADLQAKPKQYISAYIEDSSSSSSSLSMDEQEPISQYKLPFIRIVLRKTELMLLFEQHSMTAIKNTEDGNDAEIDNKQYDYLTIGRGKVRRRSEAETQTLSTLHKSRRMNTIPKQVENTASFVSHSEMHDTYKKLEDMDGSIVGPKQKFQLQTISRQASTDQQWELIEKLPTFQFVSMIMKRLLAGNVFEMSQRRYRNMKEICRSVDKIDFKYSMNRLFTIEPYALDNERKAVADISFCYGNSDIMAVAYGIYSYQAAKMPTTGEVCIWSIKNPNDPERYYSYNYPVTALEFSPYTPTLLAVGLFDGSVEVLDISNENKPCIATLQRKTSANVDPVLALKWIKQVATDDVAEIDPFLSLSQDGTVTRFHIINSPFLLGVKQMSLERIEGNAEGLQIKLGSDMIQHSNPRPEGLNLIKNPLYADIYYILTDEGCVHKCSTNYQHHYLEVLKTHESSVNCMDFSPWSPKLFLTCGNDWFIRIWMEGIFKPLISLQNFYGPYQWAAWSRTHSTVLVALNRKECEIWDLNFSTLKPIAIHPLESSFNTLAQFTRDGTSIAIGNERGKIFINALDDMPFPPYYQYDALEMCLHRAVLNFPDLLLELESVGFFGYTNKSFVMPA